MDLRCVAFALATLVFGSAAAADETSLPFFCKDNPKVRGECFIVHGRARVYNGTPSVRIWPIASKRLLGIGEQFYVDGEYSNAPESLMSKLSFDADVYADFVVCPFEPEQEGQMRLVCVERADNMQVRRSSHH